MSELQIIYKNNKPYGIRNENGFLLFFSNLHKYTGQEERYRMEIEEQLTLADFLLNTLKQRNLASHQVCPLIGCPCDRADEQVGDMQCDGCSG